MFRQMEYGMRTVGDNDRGVDKWISAMMLPKVIEVSVSYVVMCKLSVVASCHYCRRRRHDEAIVTVRQKHAQCTCSQTHKESWQCAPHTVPPLAPTADMLSR